MKRAMLTAAIAALAFSSAAFAGPDGKGQGKGHDKGKAQKQAVQRVVTTRDARPVVITRDARGVVVTRDARGNAPKPQGRHDNGLHLGHAKQRASWDRGDRIPEAYLDSRYYVDDYASYRLAPPPAGMVWVQPYEDMRRFYLVQTATGLITRILGL